MDVLSKLDNMHNTDAFDNDTKSIEESWIIVLANLNRCTDEQILELEPYCHSKVDY